MQDLAIVSSLQRLPETLPDHFVVRREKRGMNRYGAAESFELLIEENRLNSNSHATSSRIVASRFHE
jgi:hypothetical protein